MGIRLDWEVESEGGSEEVAEDAAVLATQRRKQVITQRALLIGAAVVIAGAVVLGLRLRQVRAKMLDALNATIEAESLALRLGDKHRFMLLQGAAENWRSEQRRNFDIFQNSNPPMTVTDEILDLEMNGDEARVTLRVMIGDTESTAVWLYGYSNENGWRHIGTEAEPWARQVIEANGYRIEYQITDQETAAEVDEIMRGWWHSAAALSAVDEPLPITIVLDNQKQRMVWEDTTETRLIVPSRDQDGRPRNLLDPGFYRAFSMQLADRWMRYVLNDREFAAEDAWFEAETQLWMRQIFDPQAITPPVFSQLTGAFGVDLVPELLKVIREEPEISVAAALDHAMRVSAPGAVVRGRLDRYFTRMLQAEFLYEQAWGHADGWETTGMFSDTSRDNIIDDAKEAFYSGRVDPNSITVFDVEQFGDVMWARVQFNYYTEVWEGSDTIIEQMLIYVPFIERNGYWVHTWPTLNDWGAWAQISGDDYSFMYRELEGEQLGNSDALLNRWLSLYESIAADFGMMSNPYLRIMIQPKDPRSFYTGYATDVAGPLMVIEIPSIYSYWGTPDEDFEFYWNKGGAAIIEEVFNYQSISNARIGTQPGSQASVNYIPRAIMEWEMDRHGVGYQAWPAPTHYPPDAYIPATLNGIWITDATRGGAAEHVENTAQYLGAKVLVDLLLEQYGIEALPAMIRATAGRSREPQFIIVDGLIQLVPMTEEEAGMSDVDWWLTESLDIKAADIEAEWLERYLNALREYGVPNLIPQE